MSPLKCDISNWKPLSLELNNDMFKDSLLEKEGIVPYWAEVNIEFLPQAINAYQFNKKLDLTLKKKNKKPKSNNFTIKI